MRCVISKTGFVGAVSLTRLMPDAPVCNPHDEVVTHWKSQLSDDSGYQYVRQALPVNTTSTTASPKSGLVGEHRGVAVSRCRLL
jgi:hypothetical protein